ncbi:hypothetical protein BLSTO_06604 [Blastocystis sp. subtype 1]
MWRGDATSALGRSMCACDAKGALMVNVVKMFRTPDAEDFLAFGRVLSGVVKSGMEVDVLGESYSSEDTEDIQHCTVTGVAVGEGRYNLEVTQARAGNWWRVTWRRRRSSSRWSSGRRRC